MSGHEIQNGGLRIETQTGAHSFEIVIDLIEGTLLCPTHQRGGDKVCQAELFIGIQNCASAEISADNNRWTVEIGTCKNCNAIGQHFAIDIVGPGKADL